MLFHVKHSSTPTSPVKVHFRFYCNQNRKFAIVQYYFPTTFHLALLSSSTKNIYSNMTAPVNASTSYFDKNVPKVVLQSLFKKYDVDGSGVLSQKELRQLFEGDLGMTKDQAEAYSMLLDKDGSQTVSFEELHQWLSSGEKFKNVNDKCRFYRLKKAVEMFKKYDADGNGSIEKEEFTDLMIAINCPRDKIPEALKSLDRDGDGKISFPEFLRWLNWLPN